MTSILSNMFVKQLKESPWCDDSGCEISFSQFVSPLKVCPISGIRLDRPTTREFVSLKVSALRSQYADIRNAFVKSSILQKDQYRLNTGV